jgi:UDPglucose 6-dehydrogenase/GDP-mannose 6-dehydrogenase
MRVSVIGAGYVGLVSGVCLAAKGHEVICVDIDKEKVANINNGIPPIYEKGLEDLLKDYIGKSLVATDELHKAVLDTDLSLIAVGTPFDGEHIDLSYIEDVSRQIGEAIKDKDSYHVVVVKSTVVPGTSDEVVLPMLESASGKMAGTDFGVGMNPEFLREGEAIDDFMYPDRIVLGGIDKKTHDVLRDVYSPFAGVDVLETNNKTAEMIKYTSNALLATMISFSNEIGNLCAALGGIDVTEVMSGVHLDKRLSPVLDDGTRITPKIVTYIEAGCGFGGSCFPKDVKALIAYGKQSGEPMDLLSSVITVNKSQPDKVLGLLGRHFPSFDGLIISVLGLAFKPGTDDMRESPAIPIVNKLIAQGAFIKAYDPVAKHVASKIFDGSKITFCDDLSETIDNADGVLLLTRWDKFREVPELLSRMDKKPVFIDGRRMLDKNTIENYEGIGLTSR